MLMFAKSRVSGAKERTATQSETGCGGARSKNGWWKQSLWIALQLCLYKRIIFPLFCTLACRHRTCLWLRVSGGVACALLGSSRVP
jgi:hypothetical protein